MNDPMVGQYVALWVYVRGHAARDLPYTLWRMIEDAGDWDKLTLGHENCDPALHGDLIDFVGGMIQDDRIWILISDNETGFICGIGWFGNFKPQSATVHIWMAPTYRGRQHSREAVRLGLAFGHQELKKSILLAFTSLPLARNLARRAGMKDVCFIPTLFGEDVWLLEHRIEE